MSDKDSGDESKGTIEKVVDEAKPAAVEVYRDALKPTVSVVGETLGSIVKLGLRPLKALADGGNRLMDKLFTRVAEKLKDVPPERLLPPPSAVAGQAAMNYVLLGDEEAAENLRELYAGLLASAMDRNTTSDVHPAFVHIIAQLSPDEARILQTVDIRDMLPLIEIRRVLENGVSWVPVVVLSTLGLDIVSVDRLPRIYENLARLGLMEIKSNLPVDHQSYERLDELGKGLGRAMEKQGKLSRGESLHFIRGSIVATTLCRDFLKLCLPQPAHSSDTAPPTAPTP